jgi:hypothetical protein
MVVRRVSDHIPARSPPRRAHKADIKLLLQLVREHQRSKVATMRQATAILEFETPHFTAKLDENLLKIDLRGSLKNEIEEALENKPILKETIGSILSIFVPLHVRLSDVDSVQVDEKGKLKIDLPHHRNMLIPLEREDSQKLADKLNELIPKARKKELERTIRKRTLMLQERAKKHARHKGVPPSSYVTMPWYFPTEQVDNVGKLRPRKRRKRHVR